MFQFLLEIDNKRRQAMTTAAVRVLRERIHELEDGPSEEGG